MFCWIGPGSATIGGYAIFISLLLFSCHSRAVIGLEKNNKLEITALKSNKTFGMLWVPKLRDAYRNT